MTRPTPGSPEFSGRADRSEAAKWDLSAESWDRLCIIEYVLTVSLVSNEHLPPLRAQGRVTQPLPAASRPNPYGAQTSCQTLN